MTETETEETEEKVEEEEEEKTEPLPPPEPKTRRRRNESDRNNPPGDESSYVDCPDCGALFRPERVDLHRVHQHGLERRSQTAPPPPEKEEKPKQRKSDSGDAGKVDAGKSAHGWWGNREIE